MNVGPRRSPYAPGAWTPPPELGGRDGTIERASVALDRIAYRRAARNLILYGLAVRGTVPVPELFVSAKREPISRAGFEYILDKHVHVACVGCPSLATKRVSPHVLRHTCALTVLEATKDIRKVSLWLGHAHMQTTEMYTRADPSIKLETLNATTAPHLRSGRFRATDKLIASLTAGSFMRCEDRQK